MAIYLSSHNAHNYHFGHIRHYGSTNYGHKFDLYGCPWKIWSKCRSPVKTVLKKINPTQFTGQNKKKCEKKWPFLGNFLKTAGTLPQLIQSFWFWGGEGLFHLPTLIPSLAIFLVAEQLYTHFCVCVCLSVCQSVLGFCYEISFYKTGFVTKCTVYKIIVQWKAKQSVQLFSAEWVCSTAAYTLYTVQLNCRSSRSPWAGLLSRRTQRRTINPKPYNRVARSLRTSEALIHLRKKSPGFPELGCSRRYPLASGQLCMTCHFERQVITDKDWSKLSHMLIIPFPVVHVCRNSLLIIKDDIK